jgi:hypothetical protein
MKVKRTLKLIKLAAAALLFSSFHPQLSTCFAGPLGTAITYQGRLNDGANPANGRYDFNFALYDAVTGGALRGAAVTTNGVGVSNGLFTATLDFGAGVFDGNERWLQIAVRTNGSLAGFTPLTSRQPLTPVPYATYTPSAGAAANAAFATTAGLANSVAPGAVTQLGSPGGALPNAVQVNTNGWVGIGTSAPAAALEVAGGAPVLGAVVLSEITDGTGSFTNLYSVYTSAFSTNLLAAGSSDLNAVTLADTSGDWFYYRSSIRQGQGAFTNLTGVAGLAFSSGNLLAVAAYTANAVTLVEVSNPASPVWRAVLRDGVAGWNLLGGARAVAFNGNVLAIAGYSDNAVTFANVANPVAPVLAGYVQSGFNGFTEIGGPRALAFSGNLLAIAAYTSNAVTLADLSNPATPSFRATLKNGQNGFNYLGGPLGLAFSGSLLAVAAYTPSAVTLVDVSSPTTPVLRSVIQHGVGGVTQLCRPSGVALFQDSGRTLLAVSASSSGAVSVFDVTDAAHPAMRGVFSQNMAGLHYLYYVSSVAVNANGRLVLTSPSYSALTLLGLSDQQTGLASDSWVGIGTTLPKAALDVSGDVLFENANRFQASAYHIELGDSTLATGNDSFAAGFGSKASGSVSTAMGNGAVASGDSSMALGYNTVASGYGSTALGMGSVASGSYSTALGYYTKATNTAAFAAGNSTIAGGQLSTALGYWAKALHDGTFVWGDSQNAEFASTGVNQFLIRAGGGVGIGVANPSAALEVAGTVKAAAFAVPTNQPLALLVNGQPALTLGLNNTLTMNACSNTGLSSVALGYGTKALSPYATALGYSTTASNYSSTALGNGSVAGGQDSIAAGYGTRATGDYSTAMGYGSIASGTAATALGNGTTAAGLGSFAAGVRANANHTGSFVWSDSSSGSFSSEVNDQFLIRAAGGVSINTTVPAGALHVNGTAWATSFRSDSDVSFNGTVTCGTLNAVGSASVGGNITANNMPNATWSQRRDQRIIQASSTLILASCDCPRPASGVIVIMASAGVIPFSTWCKLQLLDGSNPITSPVLTERLVELSTAATSATLVWVVPIAANGTNQTFSLLGRTGSASSVTILDVNLTTLYIPQSGAGTFAVARNAAQETQPATPDSAKQGGGTPADGSVVGNASSVPATLQSAGTIQELRQSIEKLSGESKLRAAQNAELKRRLEKLESVLLQRTVADK